MDGQQIRCSFPARAATEKQRMDFLFFFAFSDTIILGDIIAINQAVTTGGSNTGPRMVIDSAAL